MSLLDSFEALAKSAADNPDKIHQIVAGLEGALAVVKGVRDGDHGAAREQAQTWNDALTQAKEQAAANDALKALIDQEANSNSVENVIEKVGAFAIKAAPVVAKCLEVAATFAAFAA